MSPAPPTSVIPERLGRYRLERELGRGAWGRVYLAHDPQINRPVAIKIVSFDGGLDESLAASARERFLREAQSIGRLVHPAIVTLYDVDEAEGQLFLVLEYVEGDALERYLRPPALLPWPSVIEMIAFAAEGLAHAHQAGIVHRDIKPANLLRVGAATLKIADFGLARPPQAELTHDGTLRGTPAYMAPEQIRGLAVDPRSDLFSLAVVLYELLVGERPFRGEAIPSLLYRIVHDPPADSAEGPRPLTAGLSAFIERALAKSPEERFPDGQAFADALRAATAVAVPARGVPAPADSAAEVEMRGPVSSDSARVVRQPTTARATRGWFILAAVGLAAVLAAGTLLWRDRRTPVVVEPVPLVVRTEPVGLAVSWNGEPISTADRVLLDPSAPLGVLTANFACRQLSHAITPADLSGEVVLVADPIELDGRIETDPPATVRVNGAVLGQTPIDHVFDLCRENRLQFEAVGHRPFEVLVPAGATPAEARLLLDATVLVPLPRGTLEIEANSVPLGATLTIGGRRVSRNERLELEAGSHEVRVVDAGRWIDQRQTVDVLEGRTTTLTLEPLRLGSLVVQAFPPNARVYLRRARETWRFVDETPVERELAVGRYEIKVEFVPSGRARTLDVDLGLGENPPVRVSLSGD